MSETMGKNRARFRTTELFRVLKGWGIMTGEEDFEFEGVVTDSRAVEKENIFFALKGERFDGHKFLPQIALVPDVAAVVEVVVDVEKPSDDEIGLRQLIVPDTLKALGDLARFHRQRFNIPLVGITGSYGKTSTRALLDAVLSSKWNTLASQGNFNNEIGVPMTLFQLNSTQEVAVIEMGMRGRGQIDYLAKVAQPTIGLITNIGPQHIELLGSVEEIALAKAELIENLPENGLAVLPFDSEFFELLRSKTRARVVTFGTREGADYRVTQVQVSPEGWVEFSVEFGSKEQPVVLPIPGVHNALNATAAFALAHQMGVEPEAIALALEGAQLPGARMRVVKIKSSFTLIDDCYNAGPDSMRAGLQTLLDFPGGGRRVAVLGDMKELGEFSELEHRKIGAFAGQFVELLIGVGGETRPLLNSAIEAARQIEQEMETHWFNSAQEAREEVGKMIRENDVVLVKGSRSVGLEAIVEELSR